jgi:hypothetical protein
MTIPVDRFTVFRRSQARPPRAIRIDYLVVLKALEAERKQIEEAISVVRGMVEEEENPAVAGDGKDPAAVSLGRRGGKKGGRRRAESMSPAERSAAARKAARARWGRKKIDKPSPSVENRVSD